MRATLIRSAVTISAAVAILIATLGSSNTPARVHAQEPQNFVFHLDCVYHVGQPDSSFPAASIIASFRTPQRSDVPANTTQIWIDISLFNNNFAPGTFIGAGPFTPQPDVSEFSWSGLLVNRRHFYRLNALTTTGSWVEVGRGAFDTPDCRNVSEQFCSLEGVLTVGFNIHRAPRIAADGPGGGGSLDASEQWLDLSLSNNNFAPGTFIGAGPFPGNVVEPEPVGRTLGWTGILPARTHFYRINALYGRNWMPIERGSFVSLDCRNVPAPDVDGPLT